MGKTCQRDPDLVQLGELGMQLHGALARYVRANRLGGVSWANVGRLLGVSKQAAMKRWRFLDDEPVVVHVEQLRGGARESYVTCPRTGAVFGRLEQSFVAAVGYVPLQSLRELVSDDQARELGYRSAAELAAEVSFDEYLDGFRRRQQELTA